MRKLLPNFRVAQDNNKSVIILNGHDLKVLDIVQAAKGASIIKITDDIDIISELNKSCHILSNSLKESKSIYGVNTNFGGMANTLITSELDQINLQHNLLYGLKCSVGEKLSISDIRAGMLVRANALLHGVSGIRPELIERYVIFLNAHITPLVREHGSIGASGDLIPLAQIAGAIIGLDKRFKVDFDGKEIDAITALKRVNLLPLRLRPKEALAMINGTAMMTGIASLCAHRTQQYFNISLYIHAFYIQALKGSREAFHPFIHQHKQHRGQIAVAKKILDLLLGSRFIVNHHDECKNLEAIILLQDRYSIRCLPQYLGPLIEGIETTLKQVEIEANSASDNPLIDNKSGLIYQSGNFMGEYISIGMDQLRHYLALMAKHLDVQIALLVTPEFSNHLSASLAGNATENVRFGLKGLQICGNSIVPHLLHLANPISTLFPTHAEQYNQNINSLGLPSANLTRKALDLFKQYLAINLIFAVQAVDLRSYQMYLNYNTRAYLSNKLCPLYEAIYSITNKKLSAKKPYIYKDNEQVLDELIIQIASDLDDSNGIINKAIHNNSI